MPNLAQTLQHISIEAGGPGSGRHKLLWHGTSIRLLNKIKKEGLVSGRPHPHSNIYFTRRQDLAEHAALGDAVWNIKSRSRGLVLHVKAPVDQIRKTDRHPDDIEEKHYKDKKWLQQNWGEFAAVTTYGHVPPEQIDWKNSYTIKRDGTKRMLG